MDLILFGILNKRIREVASSGGSPLIIDDTLTISGHAADAKIVGDRLAELLQALDDKVTIVEGKGLSSNDLTDELLAKLEGIPLSAGDSVVKVIRINNAELVVDENGAVNIPVAAMNTLGVVKSSTEDNCVSVSEDGTMQVNAIHVSKIVASEDDEIVLGGGDSNF